MLNNNSKGFTLIELMLVVALLAITAGVAGDIIISVTQSYNKTQIGNEIEQIANFSLSKLEKELRNGRRVSSPEMGTPSTVLSFVDRNSHTVCYRITSEGDFQRYISPNYDTSGICVEDYATLLGGAKSMVEVDAASSSFTKTSNAPEIVKLNVKFRQKGSVGDSFTGSVTLNNVIVVRGTY
jgi:prepilin-type N-terminal cleavage/methylation domain-containing protein